MHRARAALVLTLSAAFGLAITGPELAAAQTPTAAITAPAVDARVAAAAASVPRTQEVADASPTAGDWFVWRYNVSSGDYDVTVRHGSSSDNYCELFISAVPYSLAKYETRLEKDNNIILDLNETPMIMSQGDIDHWVIEPGAAVPHSYGARVQIRVSRWVGGPDGHWEFVHDVHIGIYGPYEGRTRFGPPGSQPFVGC